MASPFAGVSVCATGVNSSEENWIRSRTEALGGTFHDNLVNNTTFLLVKRVGTSKYSAARKLKIPTLVLQWLKDCSVSKAKVDHESYRTLPFEGLTVCFSHIEIEERYRLQRLFESNGGTSTRDLVHNEVSHLVLETSEGEKYKAARMWGNVSIITKDWVHACVDAKKWVPEIPYVLNESSKMINNMQKQQTQESKAEKEAAKAADEAALKAAHEKYEARKLAKIKVMAAHASPETKMRRLAAERLEQEKKEQHKVAMRPVPWGDFPRVSELGKSQSFDLRREIFFISGFSPEHMNYLITLGACAGARRHMLLTPAVTKIFLGPYADGKLASEATKHPYAPCLRVEWMVEELFPGLLEEKEEERERKREEEAHRLQAQLQAEQEEQEEKRRLEVEEDRRVALMEVEAEAEAETRSAYLHNSIGQENLHINQEPLSLHFDKNKDKDGEQESEKTDSLAMFEKELELPSRRKTARRATSLKSGSSFVSRSGSIKGGGLGSRGRALKRNEQVISNNDKEVAVSMSMAMSRSSSALKLADKSAEEAKGSNANTSNTNTSGRKRSRAGNANGRDQKENAGSSEREDETQFVVWQDSQSEQ